MNIIDFHCDLLSRMLADDSFSFADGKADVDVNLKRLKQGKVGVQVFALYLSEVLKKHAFDNHLEMIDIFRRKVLSEPDMALVTTGPGLEAAWKDGRIGAILSLEGVDGLGGNFTYLRTLFSLGVRCLGLTWNPANWAADGVGESRGGGLTQLGRYLVAECNRLGMILDVSHLSEAGFWELADLSSSPFIASHSNVRVVCDHRRNLTDDQILAVGAKGGRVGITFVPWFVKENGAAVSDLLTHIDHICALGGAGIIGLGSDFDGFDPKLAGLGHPGDFPYLANELLKRYSQDLVEGFLYKNWYSFLRKWLPAV